MNNGQIASGYIKRGWAVLPLHSWVQTRDGWGCSCGNKDCHSPAKHPIPKNGLNVASTDEALVKAWWKRWPYANIGIRTGAVSGLVVLDVDPRHGGDESLYALKSKCALPDTVEVITGSGGRHVYFQHPGKLVRNSAGKIGAGLDIRGDGGYIVAPGSNHKSGGHYDWEASSSPDLTAIAPLPQPLIDLIAEDHAARQQSTYVEGAVVAAGGRNAYLTSLAGAMRHRGMAVRAIAYALWYENLDKCAPPLTADEVKSIARSIGRYEPTRGLNG